MSLGRLANRGFKENHSPRPGLRWSCDESGQDLIEYALLSAVLAVGVLGSIQALAGGIIPFFDRVLAAFQSL
jgi:Flp pilus assembly pilin Flp